MKITINTQVLSKYNITLGEFLLMLIGYHEINYEALYKKLVDNHLIEPNLFDTMSIVLSNNSRDLVARILTESDDRIINSDIDFDGLAKKLQELYPDGIKAGKTYPWRGKTEEIAQKLRVLVSKLNFEFTEEEAIAATKEYIESFEPPYTFMHTLRNFLLYTTVVNGQYEMESQFMTIVENNRFQDEHSGGDIGDLDDALG